jgi:hypothetical protein
MKTYAGMVAVKREFPRFSRSMIDPHTEAL